MVRFTSLIDITRVDSIGDDAMIVNAAAVSTGALISTERKKGLIRYLMNNRHGSPFEHGSITFLVRAPIFVWREHMRHRIGFSYNEESGRYKQLEPEFYMPVKPRTQTGRPGHYNIIDCDEDVMRADMEGAFKAACQVAYSMYEDMLSHDIAREVARMVLPVNIMSSAYVTCNPRSLMSFLSLRTDNEVATYPSKPMKEINIVADRYEAFFKSLWPETWSAFDECGRVAP